MKFIRCAVFALALATVTQPARAASTFTLDATDMWWNSNESGWGLNVIQQYDTMFLSFFVYDQAGAPIWYVAPQTAYSFSDGKYSGPLYRTTGPWIGAVFTANNVGVTQVGTVTFDYQSSNQASLIYTVDGLTVTKVLSRLTWKTNLLGASYTGAIRQVQSICTLPYVDGVTILPATFDINDFGTTATIVVTTNADRCNYSGTHEQGGHVGRMQGTYTCASGKSGQYLLYAIEASTHSISGLYVNQAPGCDTFVGSFGAVRN